MTTENDLTTALTELTTCLADLRCARLAATRARDNLTCARAARAEELVGLITEAIDHCSRLHTIVTGDFRCENLAMGGL
jgi:hypothetical protein